MIAVSLLVVCLADRGLAVESTWDDFEAVVLDLALVPVRFRVYVESELLIDVVHRRIIRTLPFLH